MRINFTKPTIAIGQLRDVGLCGGFGLRLGSPNIKFICRTGLCGRAPAADYPLRKIDEVDGAGHLDNVLMPGNVLFLSHTKSRDVHPGHAAAAIPHSPSSAEFEDGGHE